jgi:hypothetical protein
MTEPDQVAEAAPEPVTPPAPEPAPAPAVHSSRAAEITDELEKIRADVLKGITAVLRVLPPHSSFTYGGVTITNQPTTVAAEHVPGLTEAAANSGVTLVQEA